jgi:hypothetical protein
LPVDFGSDPRGNGTLVLFKGLIVAMFWYFSQENNSEFNPNFQQHLLLTGKLAGHWRFTHMII